MTLMTHEELTMKIASDEALRAQETHLWGMLLCMRGMAEEDRQGGQGR